MRKHAKLEQLDQSLLNVKKLNKAIEGAKNRVSVRDANAPVYPPAEKSGTTLLSPSKYTNPTTCITEIDRNRKQ